MLAVTATLDGGNLLIKLDAANDAAELYSDGTKYFVRGNNADVANYKIADVTGFIRVFDAAANANQKFTVKANGANNIVHSLRAEAGIELTNVYQKVAVPVGKGGISLASPTTNLAAGLEAQDAISLAGAVQLFAADVAVTAGPGDVTFSNKVSSSGPNYSLTVRSRGQTTLAGAIDLLDGGLRVEGDGDAGVVRLAGGSIKTRQQILFGNPVILAADTTISTDSQVVFDRGIDALTAAGQGLSISAGANIFLVSADGVGSKTPLKNLKTTAGGDLQVYGNITTAGATGQVYETPVLLKANVVFTSLPAGNITFAGEPLDDERDALRGPWTATFAAGAGKIFFLDTVGRKADEFSNEPYALAGLSFLSAAAVSAPFAIMLDGSVSVKAATDGLSIAAGVNNVVLTGPDSSIRNFKGHGVSFKGDSTGSKIGGFAIAANGGDGVRLEPGSYAGTKISGNTIESNYGHGVRFTKAAGPFELGSNGIYRNGMNGIDGESSTNATIIANKISENRGSGIRLAAVSGAISQNSIWLNGAPWTPPGGGMADGGNSVWLDGTAPSGLKATAGNGEVQLTWNAPASNGGSAITDYRIEASKNGGAWEAVADDVSTMTSAKVTGLANGSSYRFRVAAVNAGGTLPFSADSAAVTPVLPPTISGVTPSVGATAGGTRITVTGTNFVAGSTRVFVGGGEATNVTVIGPTQLMATTPAGVAGLRDVAVKTGSGTVTRSGVFTYVPAPSIAAVTPSSGPLAGGTRITVTGTNFVAGSTQVRVGNSLATNVTVIGSTQLTAVTPAGTVGAKDVSVITVGGVTTRSAAFTYIATPSITAVTPSSGPLGGGTTITVTGANFVAGLTTQVRVGGVLATNVIVVSSTQLMARIPAGSVGPKDVTVTTIHGTATRSGAFTYLAAPTITAVTPSSGPTTGGTRITLTGSNFVAGSTQVRIGGVLATNVEVISATQLTASTPAGSAGPKDVTVTTAGGTGTRSGAFRHVATVLR